MSGRLPRDRLQRVGDAAGRSLYYDDERGTYHLWFDERTYEPVSTAVLFGVSRAVDTPPEELEELSSRIDPDALNELFCTWRNRERAGSGSVAFRFAGCSVTVYADGEVVIEPQ
ncbi:HalOD1 output domain-containing protein [Natrononativus amylolyticus]|uniref:HalOD1 output domain-containing protein n=1 Tax=Natrononativus amylolyticus TaxID=2963434 RepID=UPI0020CCFB6A|nr:HalOD1 output domain-containing protein [Natrononativus amylolyticus]